MDLNSRNACTRFVAEHFRQQLGAGLAIAVFAGKRAAVAHHQVRGLFHEVAICAHAFRSLQVEGDAAVDAAIAEVAENRPAVMVFAQQLVEIAEVISEDFRRHRGIFPGRPRVLDMRHAAGAHAGFANMPDLMLLGGIVDHLHPGVALQTALRFHSRASRARPRASSARFAAEFRDQPCVAFAEAISRRERLSLCASCFR